MRLKTILIVVLLLIAVIGSSANSFACSTFMLKKDTSFIFGHNLDERQDFAGYVFVNKRGIKKINFNRWEYIWRTNKTKQVQWVSKYGSITFNNTKKDFPDGGINEAGLYIWEMSLIETKYPEDNSKPHLIVDQWIQYQLDNYQNVAEVIQHLSETVPYTNAWHFFIADKQGNCAVIEFVRGKAIVYTDKSMPVTVLCNSQYDLEMYLLNQYKGFGGKWDPFSPSLPAYLGDSRFVQGATMIRDYLPGKSKPVVEYGFDILKQMERGNNRWQIVIDIQKSMVYFHTSIKRKIKYFSYKNFDFSPNSPVKVFDINTNLAGDISKKFINYTWLMNTSLEIKNMDTILKIYPNSSSPTIKIVLAILIVILISPFIVWMFLYIKRSLSAKKLTSMGFSSQNRLQSFAARIIAVLNSILNLIFIYLLARYCPFIAKFGLGVCGNIYVFALFLIMSFTAGEIILIINLWKNKTWSLWERFYYILLILAAVSVLILFIVVLIIFHNVGT